MSAERERNGRLDRSLSRSRSRSRSPRRRGGGGRGKSSGDEQKMVYISNIPYDVRWMELKDIVREKAGDVAFVEVIEKDGKSKGCAVVEFKDRESAKKCVENMHRMSMKDRLIVVKEIRDPERFFKKVKEETGVDFLANKSGPQSFVNNNMNAHSHSNVATNLLTTNYETYGLSPSFLKQLCIDGPLCNRVFVANLSFTAGSSKLKELFSLAGQVTDVDIQLDKEGKSKGLAVIEYSHPIEAVQAISMLHNQKFQDRTMTVKMDRFDKPIENRRPGELPVGLKGLGMGLGANGTPLTNIAQLVSSGAFGGSSNNFGGNLLGGGANLGSGLDSNRIFSSSSLGSLGGSANLGSGGLGSNVFGNSSLNNSNLGGGGSLYGSGQSLSSLGGGGGGGGGGGSLGYGSNMGSTLDSYRGSGSLLGAGDFDRYGRLSPPRGSMRLSRAIIIRNLPPDYNWQTLRDRMRGFGEVEFSDMIQAGVGKVRFKTASDAEKAAVSLHGILVEGSRIAVDLAASD